MVDEVLGYYNVSKDVESIIQNGPTSGNLDDYLQATASIELAIKYFEKNNSKSVELENLVCPLLLQITLDQFTSVSVVVVHMAESFTCVRYSKHYSALQVKL